MARKNDSFGGALRGARTAARKTLGDVARHMGVSISFLSDVEHGRRNPLDSQQITAVAAFLGVASQPLLVAAAKERQSVKISSQREDVLEVAAGLARVLENADDTMLARLRELMEEVRDDKD